jgi:hypothetical protein
MAQRKTKDVTAENTFTDALDLQQGRTAAISVSGTFSATVTLQRSIDGNWRDVEDYTTVVEKNYTAGTDEQIRVGVKTSNYTSGTVSIVVGGGV